jgi:hypothetical protein
LKGHEARPDRLGAERLEATGKELKDETGRAAGDVSDFLLEATGKELKAVRVHRFNERQLQHLPRGNWERIERQALHAPSASHLHNFRGNWERIESLQPGLTLVGTPRAEATGKELKGKTTNTR